MHDQPTTPPPSPSFPPARRILPARRLCAAALSLGLVAGGGWLTVHSAGADEHDVTIRPEPAAAADPFQGWGTSLVWFADATGDYPDEIREELAELVFGDQGLGLNIARYNVGGGNAPDVTDYLRAGGAVEGWWQAPDGTTREDRDWWSADDPGHWNEDADATQRWWVEHVKDDVDHWEVFSNSPPWFMTESGYVSGGFDASEDQLRTESVDDFTAYLVGVAERLEAAHGIEIGTIAPFNEPNTDYWSTELDGDGEPVGGRQEGAHMGPELQQTVILALAERLNASETVTGAGISAMDETNPGRFAENWEAYSPQVREAVDQMNVHTYGTGDRHRVRELADEAGKPLWMSEVDGGFSQGGQDFEGMEPGLGLARHMVDDLNWLSPDAWVFWQVVEDYDNMAPGGEFEEGGNWGLIQVPFSCTSEDTLESCPAQTNRKFDTARNFTHHIRPGDRLVPTGEEASAAALTENGASVVHVNDTSEERTVRLDLTGFGDIQAGATVTPVMTDAKGSLVEWEPVEVQDGYADVTVPAESVTTLVVEGVTS